MTNAKNNISFEEFLVNVPPGISRRVGILAEPSRNYDGHWSISMDLISLHCEDNACGRTQYFRPLDNNLNVNPDGEDLIFVRYQCKNCGKYTRIYSLAIRFADKSTADVYKIGEYPTFGPPTSKEMFSLVGEEKALYLKGRVAENQGMGIAAFSYYRRVVESQKNMIIDKIIEVSRMINASKEMIAELEDSKKEVRFTSAVDKIKKGIPESLLIKGENPLILLHTVLSKHIHELTDEECLEFASNIRIVLTEFAERLDATLKNDPALAAAVTKLKQFKEHTNESKNLRSNKC